MYLHMADAYFTTTFTGLLTGLQFTQSFYILYHKRILVHIGK